MYVTLVKMFRLNSVIKLINILTLISNSFSFSCISFNYFCIRRRNLPIRGKEKTKKEKKTQETKKKIERKTKFIFTLRWIETTETLRLNDHEIYG